MILSSNSSADIICMRIVATDAECILFAQACENGLLDYHEIMRSRRVCHTWHRTITLYLGLLRRLHISVAGLRDQSQDKGLEIVMKVFDHISKCRSSRLPALLDLQIPPVRPFPALASRIASQCRLLTLDMSAKKSKIKLGDDGAVTLAHVLGSLSSLRALRLSHNAIEERGCEAISRGLQMIKKLQDLDLSWNRISSRACKALCSSSSGLWSLSCLTSLKLSGNLIGISMPMSGRAGGIEACQAVGKLLSNQCMSGLTCLRLDGNGIGEKECRALCESARMLPGPCV